MFHGWCWCCEHSFSIHSQFILNSISIQSQFIPNSFWIRFEFISNSFWIRFEFISNSFRTTSRNSISVSNLFCGLIYHWLLCTWLHWLQKVTFLSTLLCALHWCTCALTFLFLSKQSCFQSSRRHGRCETYACRCVRKHLSKDVKVFHACCSHDACCTWYQRSPVYANTCLYKAPPKLFCP